MFELEEINNEDWESTGEDFYEKDSIWSTKEDNEISKVIRKGSAHEK